MAQDILQSILSAIQHTSLTEWLITLFALIYVILAAYENSWCWLFGTLASAFSVYLCYNGKLYLESFLQLFYVIIGIYGWYKWLYGSPEKKEIHVFSLTLNKHIPLFIIGFALWLPLGYIAKKYSTQVLPYLDAFITSFSLIATWMTAKKILENWLFWIVIDSLSVVLYASREFYLIALLNILYTLIAARGYFQWKKKLPLFTE